MRERGYSLRSLLRVVLPTALTLVFVVSCTDSTVTQVGPDDVVSVGVSPDVAELPTGRTLQLTGHALDNTGALLANLPLEWRSSDPAVATVDASGLATGVSAGSVEIIVTVLGASGTGLEARAAITVAPPPLIVLSADTVRFSAPAGGADPAADSVLVTNGGEFDLVGLAIDSVLYDDGAQDWLVVQISATSAPARLDLSPMIAGVTQAREHAATVWLSGIDADNSPASVVAVLEISAGPASALVINEGDGEIGSVGASVALPPSVLVTDAFGNTVPGEPVTFAVTAGGGSVTGPTATSDAQGVAEVGSWTLGTTTGVNTLTATLAGATPVTFSVTAAAGTPTMLELSAGDGQTAVAGEEVIVAPAVLARDVFNNGVEGVVVQFTVVGGDGSVSGAMATSDGSGMAAVGGWALGALAGPNELIATLPGVSDTISFSATGVPGPAAMIELEGGDAQSDTIDATLSTPYAVRASDINGNAVGGVTVTWAVSGGGGSITGLSATGSDGVAVATRVLGTAPGTQSASATVGTLSGSPVTFTATALAGAPTSLTPSGGDGQSAGVGMPVPIAPSVTVTDRLDNPASGVQVTFAITGGGGEVAAETQTTDAAGAAQVGAWTMGTAAGANTLSATVAGVTPVAFAATATAGAATQLQLNAGDNQGAVAGQAVPVPPSVIAADQFGNAVDGVSVQFTVVTGGGSTTGATPVTASGGIAAVGSWTLGQTQGQNTLLATATGIVDTVTFTATAFTGAATSMSLDGGDAQTGGVGTTLTTPYSVLVVDTNTNGVGGIPVTWTVTGGGGSITASSVTDANGVASATRVLGTGAGAQTATASVGGLTGSPVAFTATATAGAPTMASVNNGDGQSATVGTAVTTAPSILVTDQFTNPVSGVGVTFAVTGGGGSIGGSAQVTDANGIAQAGSWTLGTPSGANTLSATPTGVSAVSFTATGTADVPTQITVSAGDNQDATAGFPVAVAPAVQVLDQFGNAVQGESVTFSVTAGGGSVSPSTAVLTDASGIAAVTSWTLGTTAGTNNNTLSALAASAGISGNPTTFTATGLVGAAASMSLDGGNAQTDTVGATLVTPYTVLIVDANANPISGTTVTWAATGGGSITSSSVSGADGIASATHTLGTSAGTQTASASVGGLTGSPVALTATATAGAATSIAVSAGNGQTGTVNMAVSVDPEVLVQDQFGNPVQGESVTFSVTAGDGSVSPSTAVVTGANGTAAVTSWTLGTVAGTNNNTLSALAAGAGVSGNPVAFTASADAGAPASIAVTSGGAQEAVTGRNVANPPTVTVTDAFSNVVPSVTVDFSASGSGSVGSASASTNASGMALTTWAVNVGGATVQSDGTFPNTLTATVQGTGISTSFAGDAVYSYATHVNPVWAATPSCTSCHGTTSGLTLSGSSSQNYMELFNVVPVCGEGGLASGYRRVSPAGGDDSVDEFSVLLWLTDASLGSVGECGPHSTNLTASQLAIVRAWIRNTAPNN